MFAIVGSGFGLYGYLPALVRAYGEDVLLAQAYRERVDARAELAPYVDRIRYAPTETDALRRATGLVIATPPARQLQTALVCEGLPNIERMVLEKPLARDPFEAQALLDRLRRAGKRVRIGYTFLHTEWGESLRWGKSGTASIHWTFTAHHFAQGLDNWKRDPAQGGGPLRFFGVHMLALLARAGYREVDRSSLSPAGVPERWEARFRGGGLPDCHLFLDTRSPERRFVVDTGAQVVDIGDPYAGHSAPGEADRRILVLEKLLRSFAADDAARMAAYEDVNRLWLAAEIAAGSVA